MKGKGKESTDPAGSQMQTKPTACSLFPPHTGGIAEKQEALGTKEMACQRHSGLKDPLHTLLLPLEGEEGSFPSPPLGTQMLFTFLKE